MRIGFAGQGCGPRIATSKNLVAAIQSQSAFCLLRFAGMAFKAAFSQDRSDTLLEKVKILFGKLNRFVAASAEIRNEQQSEDQERRGEPATERRNVT